MYNAEHHNGISLLSSVLEGFPLKALSHGSDTAGVAIGSCHKSSCSPLDSFYPFDVFCRVWIPYFGFRFHLRPHKCSVTSVLDFFGHVDISVSESCSLLMSSCRDSARLFALMRRYNRQSSAKRRVLGLTFDGRSLM